MTTHIHIHTRSKDSSSVEDAPFNYSEYLKWGRSQKIDEGKLKAEYEKWLANQKKRFPDQSAEQQETMAAKVAKSSFETRGTKEIRKLLGTKDTKFTGPESAWKTKVLNTHPGALFRPHPTDRNKVRATKDGKSVGSYDAKKREGEIQD